MKTKTAETKLMSVDYHASLAVGNFTIDDMKVVSTGHLPQRGSLYCVPLVWGTERQILRTKTNIMTNAHVLPQWPK